VKRAAILAVALVAAAAPAPAAQAAFPGRDGRIAYTSDWEPDDCGDHSCEEDVLGLNTIRPDGTGRRPIGRCGRRMVDCEEYQPAWSPDGRRIVLVHSGSIWVMGGDGSHAHRVFKGDAETPSWSPDGRHIVFTRLTGYTGWITIMRSDGSHRRRITPTDDNSYPSWSVRGLIAYTHYPPGFGGLSSIVTRRPDGRLVSRFKLRTDVYDADFSPDGKLIAFERSGTAANDDRISIWTSRPDGSHPHSVVADGNSPAWSPSGRFIAYSGPVGPFPRPYEILVVRRDGSHGRQVGPSPRHKGDRPGYYIQPTWQPLPRR
jgi:dipeptidyl aminopeptidase/acylaminoacyl peptidase